MRVLKRVYNRILVFVFFLFSAAAWAVAVRIARAFSGLETTPTYNHLFFNVLFYPGAAFILVRGWPKFFHTSLLQKHLLLVAVMAVLALLFGWLAVI